MKTQKARTVLVHIENEELQRIVEEQKGGLTLEIIVTHANIKVDARTGEDEKVNLYRFK
jgi:hypothetical protein